MADKKSPAPFAKDTGMPYEIKLRGHLDEYWSDWLSGLKITHDSQGNSLLRGAVPDQAALHGILAQIRDLGLNLISLTPQPVDVEVREITDGSNNDNAE